LKVAMIEGWYDRRSMFWKGGVTVGQCV